MHTSAVRGTMSSGGRTSARASSAVKSPPLPATANCTPLQAAAAPDSKLARWAPSPTMTSAPRSVCKSSAIWLPMVPVGTNSAASLPSRDATRSSRARVVGSSRYTSSPTWAQAIAARIAAVGRVTVSERRSNGCVVLMGLLVRADDAPRFAELHPHERARDGFSDLLLPDRHEKLGILGEPAGEHVVDRDLRALDDVDVL